MTTNIIASLHQANHRLLSEFDAYKRQAQEKILKLEDSVRRGEHDIRQLNLLVQAADKRPPSRHLPFWEERAKALDAELKEAKAALDAKLSGSNYWFEMYSNSLNEKEYIRKQLDARRLENEALFHTIESAIICINESHDELEKHLKKEASVLPLLNIVRDRILQSKHNT